MMKKEKKKKREEAHAKYEVLRKQQDEADLKGPKRVELRYGNTRESWD